MHVHDANLKYYLLLNPKGLEHEASPCGPPQICTQDTSGGSLKALPSAYMFVHWYMSGNYKETFWVT